MVIHPAFTHENDVINNFIHNLFITHNIYNRIQLILLSGVILNNVELVTYACKLDPAIVNAPILNSAITIIDTIFSSTLGKKIGDISHLHT